MSQIYVHLTIENSQFSLHQSQNKKLINFQNSRMEPEQPSKINNLIQMLAHTKNWTIINSVLSFLSHQQIEAIADLGLAGQSTRFFRTAMAKNFMDKYLNRVDRSVFFVFYEEDQFRDIEKHTTNLLAHNHHQFLAHSLTQYKQLLTSFADNTQFLASQAELQTLLQQILFQPQLPMPKLKRQTIGMFCQSSFQEFLSMIRFPSDEQLWMEEPLEELRDRLEEELTELIQQHVYGIQSPEEINKKIREVRFSGYKINSHNCRNYLIQNFKMHNIIVLLLALCSQTVNTYRQVIDSIQDPFMKFISFSLRSNIFRNIVLTIEDQFKFLFKNYTQFYQMSYETTTIYPPFGFWIPSLSIWTQRMAKFHDSNLSVYNYITAKQRENSLKEFLIIKTEKLPSFFSELKQQIQFQSFSQIRKNKVYQQSQSIIEAQSFFENNYEMYQTLSKDYVQYMVDISLNEYSVHWCGHSEHIIKKYPLFRDYYQNVVNEMLELHKFILDIISRSVPKEIRLNIFKQVVKEDLQFCDLQLFKPVVTKAVVDILNKWIKELIEDMQNYAVFDEQGFSKNKIVIDFQQKDAILKYFASKNFISQDCPQDRQFFYNIQIKDIDPVFIKEMEEECEDLQSMEQYISDEGQQMDEDGD